MKSLTRARRSAQPGGECTRRENWKGTRNGKFRIYTACSISRSSFHLSAFKKLSLIFHPNTSASFLIPHVSNFPIESIIVKFPKFIRHIILLTQNNFTSSHWLLLSTPDRAFSNTECYCYGYVMHIFRCIDLESDQVGDTVPGHAIKALHFFIFKSV